MSASSGPGSAGRRHGLSERLRSPSSLVLIGLNLAVLALLVHWVSENIRPDRLVEQVARIPREAVLVSIVINFAALAIYGVRMAMLLNCRFGPAFGIVNVGYSLNTLMPLRLGEAAKIYFAHRLFGIPLTAIFAASVAEKLFDLAKLLLLALTVAGFAARDLLPPSVFLSIAILLAAAVAAVTAFRRNIIGIIRLLPKGGRLRRVSIELHKHASAYPMGRIVLISLAIWGANVAIVHYSFNAYLPDITVGFLDSIVLLLILALAVAVPGAPAGVGLFEAGLVAYLTQRLGAGNEAALAAATVFHLVISLPQLAVTAAIFWWRAIAVGARATTG